MRKGSRKPKNLAHSYVLIVKMPQAVKAALARVAAARFVGMSAAVRSLILEADARSARPARRAVLPSAPQSVVGQDDS